MQSYNLFLCGLRPAPFPKFSAALLFLIFSKIFHLSLQNELNTSMYEVTFQKSTMHGLCSQPDTGCSIRKFFVWSMQPAGHRMLDQEVLCMVYAASRTQDARSRSTLYGLYSQPDTGCSIRKYFVWSVQPAGHRMLDQEVLCNGLCSQPDTGCSIRKYFVWSVQPAGHRMLDQEVLCYGLCSQPDTKYLIRKYFVWSVQPAGHRMLDQEVLCMVCAASRTQDARSGSTLYGLCSQPDTRSLIRKYFVWSVQPAGHRMLD